MSGLGTPQAPNSSGGLMGILSGLLSGYQGEKQQLYQTKEQKQEDVLKKQEAEQSMQMNALDMKKTNVLLDQAKLQQQDAAKASAKGDLQQLTQQMITDPSRAKDPSFVARYNELSTAAGQLPEMTKTGAVDVARLKTPFNILAADPKKMTELAQLPQAQRKAILDQFSGVPKELYSAKPFVDAKTQMAMDKVHSMDNHYLRKDVIESHLADVKSKYYDAVTGELIPAKASSYYAASGLDAARGQAVGTMANAAMVRAQAYTQSVNNVQQRFQSSPNGAMGTVRSLLSTSTSQLRGLQTAVDDAQKSLASAYANVTDPDQLAEAAGAVTQAQAALTSATEADQTLRNSVRSNPQVSAFLGAASGKATTNIGTGSNNKTEYSTSGGKPIVRRNGGPWEYVK